MKQALLAFLLLIAAATASAAESYVPTEAERARWTMFDMYSWKIAFLAYKTDHHVFPTVKTLEDARSAVEPMYILHAPMTDAWGHAYRIESDANGFRVVSAGADGVFESDVSNGGALTSFNDDAVATESGNWLFRRWVMK